MGATEAYICVRVQFSFIHEDNCFRQASHGREPFKDLSIIAFVAVEFAIPMASHGSTFARCWKTMVSSTAI